MDWKKRVGVASLSLAVLVSPVLARDADAAKGYVKEAQGLVESRDFEGAAKKIELAEAELDGVDASAKEAITKSIADVKQQITDAQAAGDRDN